MLELQNLDIKIDNTSLFPSLSISVENGEILTIMGPSGCGKSTLMSAIIGSLQPNFRLFGAIILHGERIEDLAMEKRRVGILFQDDLLFPHMNVAENLLFALPPKLSLKEKEMEVTRALERAGLAGFNTRHIDTLSGGQKARISLLRTLLSRPKAVLFDEPFSKLDTKLRANFRNFVREQIIEMNIPAIVVTHDAEDVLGNKTVYLTGESRDV